MITFTKSVLCGSAAPVDNKMMQLSDVRDLIAILPVDYQASISRSATWDKHISEKNRASEALRSVLDEFGEGDFVTLCRRDLRRLAQKQDLAQFVMATIVWGYTSGGRGKNVESLMRDLDRLTALLSESRTQPVTKWKEHYKKVEQIKGLGLSTYTKFLNFLPVEVQGRAALILDDRMIRVASRGLWKELDPLGDLSDLNAARRYPNYLECLHSLADSFNVCAEAIEYFLFVFGLSLKPPSG